jgi:ankyrin repeat protein
MLVVVTALVSCRKPVEAVKSDLGDAGYQITAKDWFRASRSDDVTALKKFLAAKFPVDTRDEAGDTALHAAAAAGAKNAADFLLDHKLPVDVRGAQDRTPLMAAVLGNQTVMERWLIRQGADPSAKDKEGFTPLMLAVREDKPAAIPELAPSNRDNLDEAILLASLLGRTEVIDSLTKYGASVYARMDDGRTPLMVAAENGHMDSVKLLIDIGAGRFSTDDNGHTAAEIATAAGHVDIAEVITRDPSKEELALETPAEAAKQMERFVDAAAAEETDGSVAASDPEEPAASPANPSATAAKPKTSPARPIQGETLSAAVVAKTPSSSPGGTSSSGKAPAQPA